MSRGSQGVQLPQIKNNETYNFVIGKKKPQQQEETEDWKKKCEELQKDVDQRNQAIFSIQRNFESLSQLLRNEKQENIGIKEEVQRLRQQNQEFQLAEKNYISQLNELKSKQNQIGQSTEIINEQKQLIAKQNLDIQQLNKRTYDLEKIIEKKIEEIQKIMSQLNQAQFENNNLRSIQLQHTNLIAQYQDLQNKTNQLESMLQDKEIYLAQSQKNINYLTEIIENLKKNESEMQLIFKSYKTKENNYILEITDLKQRIIEKDKFIASLKDQINNYQTQLQVKEQQENPQKLLKDQLQQQLKAKQSELAQEQQLRYKLENENNRLQQIIIENQTIINDYFEISSMKGQFSIKSVFDQLEQLQKETLDQQESINQYKNDFDNQNKSYNQMQREIQQLKQQIRELDREKQQSQNMLEQQHITIKTFESELVSLKQEGGKKGNQTQEYEKKILSQQKQLEDYKKQIYEFKKYEDLINESKKYQDKVQVIEITSFIEMKQQIQNTNKSNQILFQELADANQKIQQLKQLMSDAESLQQTIDQLQSNNQLLTTTNKELNQRLIDVIQEVKDKFNLYESAQQEIIALNRDNRNLQQNLNSSTDTITQQSYQLQALQKDLQANKDIIFKITLEQKNLQNRNKQLEQDLEQLNPEKMAQLKQSLEDKQKQFKSQMKNIDLAFNSQIPSISCNTCYEVLQKTITCYPCGHSCCKKCFNNQCKECKEQDGWFSNVQMDDLINKINYCKQILNTYQ